MRHGVPVIYAIDAQKMYQNGHKFYKSKNGVWLTKEVPVNYLFELSNGKEDEHGLY